MQLPLIPERQPKFDGKAFDVVADADRLGQQLETIRSYMLGRSDWRSLLEIERDTGVLTASAGARLRDLRKRKFGAFDVQRRRRDGGTYEYRIHD